MNYPVIDTVSLVSDAQLTALKHRGVEVIVQYDTSSQPNSAKQITVKTLERIAKAGLLFIPVFENGITLANFTRSTGKAHGLYARRKAAERAQPSGSTELFAVDFNPDAKQYTSSIKPYFQGVADAMAEHNGNPVLRVGSYASGLINQLLLADRLTTVRWITQSKGFIDSRVDEQRHLYELIQRLAVKNYVPGLEVDPSEYGERQTALTIGAHVPLSGGVQPAPVFVEPETRRRPDAPAGG